MATTAANSHDQHEQQQQQQRNHNKIEDSTNETTSTTKSSQPTSTATNATSDSSVVYDVEHLATFSTNGNNESSTTTNINNRSTSATNSARNDDDYNASGGRKNENARDSSAESSLNKGQNSTRTTPKVALQRLFELEKLSGIWTQHMQIELLDEYMLIVDCETNSVVERFNRECVTRPEAFNQYNDIYNNIVVFIIQQQKQQESATSSTKNNNNNNNSHHASDESDRLEFESILSETGDTNSEQEGELHIFQCVSHKAQQLVADILAWKSHKSSQMLNSDQNMANLRSHNEVTTPKQQQQQENKKSSAAKDQEAGSLLSGRDSSDQAQAARAKKSPNSTSSNKPVVTVASSAKSNSENVPIVNVNVKETVQVFNQIAALREKGKPTSPINTNNPRPLSDSSITSSQLSPTGTQQQQQQQQNSINQPEGGSTVLATQQFFKQRSIRATLAPKYTNNGVEQDGSSGSSSHSTQAQLNSGAKSSSSASSSIVADQQQQEQLLQQQQQPQHHHKSGGRHTNGVSEGMKHSKQRQPPVSSSGGHHHNHHHQTQAPSFESRGVDQAQLQQQRLSNQSESSRSQASSSSQKSQVDQVTTNESYVSVLNHCFDDIEKFIIRLQQAVTGQAALRELQAGPKRGSKLSKKMANSQLASAHQAVGGSSRELQALASASSPASISSSELAMLTARARGPSEDDYFEILSKFKLAFNLLAKLKGCIHEPNAPELVHFLFTPLAIIIDSARNASPPIDPTLVGIPYLNQDALDLLSNCCTSKESDMWISLGPNWTQTIDISVLKASRLPSSFQPIFSDGWAPIVGELELIGLVGPTQQATGSTQMSVHQSKSASLTASDCPSTAPMSAELLNNGTGEHSHHHHHHRHHHSRSSRNHHQQPSKLTTSSYMPTDTLASDSTAILAAEPQSIYSAGVNLSSNGKSGGSRKKAISGGALPAGGRTNRHYQQEFVDHLGPPAPPIDPIDQLPYNSVPYGYMSEALSGNNNNNHHHHHHQAHTSNGRRSRVPKGPQYATGGESFVGYEDGGIHNYPSAMSLGALNQPPLFMGEEEDLQTAAHQSAIPSRHHYQRHHNNGGGGPPLLHSDGYSDLNDPYLDQMINATNSDQLHSKSAPGLSTNHYHHRHHASQHSSHPQQAYHNNNRGGGSRYRGEKGQHQTKMNSHLYAPGELHHLSPQPHVDEFLLSDAEHEAMLLDLGPEQAEWFYELQSRGALIVRVLFTREANNDKELSVHRGELLEVLDDTRKWWRTRNIELQVAHVPHTIVAVMQGYQTLEELLANQPAVELEEQSLITSSSGAGGKIYPRREMVPVGGHHQPLGPGSQPSLAMHLNNNFNNNNNQHWQADKDAKRASSNSKAAGAFRYF